MHETFEKFLEIIRDENVPVGVRLVHAAREITLTTQANDALKARGDHEGLKFGEEYLRALEELISQMHRGGASRTV